MNVRQQLLELKDNKYRDFQSVLVPNINNILGVRVPDIRKTAEKLAKSSDWQDYKDDLYYEEVMIQGLLIGYANIDACTRLKLLEEFIPKIDNWGVCDVVCSNLKFTNENRQLVWEFILPYLKSDREFDVRFALVMVLSYFIDDEYIDRVLKIRINNNGYYAGMALAWALSVCLVKQWDKTFDYFKNAELPKWTYNKAIQKACESCRISKEKKALLKTLKKA